MSDNRTLAEKLQEPFDPSFIEWRVQRAGIKDGKPWAMVLAYVSARAIFDRLDSVVGPEKWTCRYEQWQGGVMASLSLCINNEWITKQDGSDASDIEPFKGSISGAIKRAAIPWGIGRYLYGLDTGFAEIVAPRTKGSYSGEIKDKITGKTEYFSWMPPQLPQWALPRPPQKPVAETSPVKTPNPTDRVISGLIRK